MALPLAVYSSNVEPMGPPMKAPNGAIYVAVTDTQVVDIYKCADPDTGSFSVQDAGNNPTGMPSGAMSWSHGCQYEHLIFLPLGILSGSEHNIYLKKFNTATDTWVSGTELIYEGGPGEIPATWRPCYLVATPNYLYCLHPCDSEKVKGIHQTRWMVSYRTLSGTSWTNSTFLDVAGEFPSEEMGLAVNSSENAVVAYMSQASAYVYGVVWNRASFGTPATTTFNCSGGIQQCVSYMDGSTNRIIFGVDYSSNARVWRTTSSGTTLTSVAVTTIEGSLTGSYLGLARWGTTLYAWYMNTSANPAYEDSSDHGATWSGAQHSDPSNNLTEHPWANCYTRKGQLKIGIVYKEGATQLSYDERSITNPSAPGFASAKTPTRQNRIFVSA